MRPPSIPPTMPINRDSDSEKIVIMKTLYNSLIEYRDPKTHRILISVFMCLPSRKDFPEYFNIIEKPISMNKIRERIDRQQYIDEESCMDDFRLMFANCKSFNDDDSQIYKDAVTLEDLLEKKLLENKIQQHINEPVEKCSLNTRRGRNSDVPKRQLLTGYIIYASEIRKQVIDKNPNQNFGDISRLVGNEWKALPLDIRSKYDERALIHNKRVRERAQRELSNPDRLTNGFHTPKLTKRKLAKLAKEQMRQHHLSIASGLNDSSIQSPNISHDQSLPVPQTPGSAQTSIHQQNSQPQWISHQTPSGKQITVDSSTQTTAIRFVEPPTKKRLVYSETFRKYIESLKVPNNDLLDEELPNGRSHDPPDQWFGAGIGRHESTKAALWALRDFMLHDAVTMRRYMEPYL